MCSAEVLLSYETTILVCRGAAIHEVSGVWTDFRSMTLLFAEQIGNQYDTFLKEPGSFLFFSLNLVYCQEQ